MTRTAIDHAHADTHDGILVIDDFLSPAECARMLEEQTRGQWIDSVVANANGGATALPRVENVPCQPMASPRRASGTAADHSHRVRLKVT